jgi:hypothetical protein
MTRKRHAVRHMLGKIDPAGFYRTTLSEEIFGLGPQATADNEEAGDIPPSSPISPSSRFRGWYGQQILDHRANMQKLAAEQLEAKRAAADQLQPKALADAVKIRKQKLRPPAKQRESA